MPSGGAVWIDVLPSLSKFNPALRAGLGTSMLGAGRSAGQEFGNGMSAGVRSGMSGVRATVKAEADAAALAVRESSLKVASARDVEAKAAGAARVAELKLQEVRVRDGAQASTVAAAEERLATATRAQAAAATKATAASTELALSQKRAGEAAATSGVRLGGLASTAERSGSRITESMKGAGKSILGLGALGVGVGFGDFLVKGVENAQKYQAALTLLTTAGGEKVKNLGIISSGLKSISNETGTSLDQLGEGMYTLEKAGLRGAQGVAVLTAAAKGAKAENVDLGTMTNALSSIMVSYGTKAGTPVQVTNELVAASGRAKTTMQEFAGSLSSVLPVASAAGISFDQVGGAVATLTQHGTSADEATQHLAFTIRALQAPNDVASKAMAQLGISSNNVATQLGTRGLQGTIDYLSKTIFDHMGPAKTVLLSTFNASKVAAADAATEFKALPSDVQALATQFINGSISLKTWNADVKELSPAQANLAKQWATSQNSANGFQQALRSGTPQAKTYTAELKAMLGGAVGLNTGLQLTGSTSTLLTANIKAIGAAAHDTSGDVTTWAATQATFNTRLAIFRSTVTNAGVDLGTKLLPDLTTFVGTLTNGVPVVVGMATSVAHLVEANKGWLGPGIAGILATVVAYRTMSAVVSGAQVVLGGAKAAYQLLGGATRAAAVAQEGENVAVASNPIGALATGIGLAVAALVTWHNHTKQQQQAVENLTQSIIADNGAVGEQTKASIVNGLTSDGTLAKYRALGLSIPLVTSAYLGNKEAITQVNAQLDAAKAKLVANGAVTNSFGRTVVGAAGALTDQYKATVQLQSGLNGSSSTMSAARQQGLLYEQGMKGSAGAMNTASGAARGLGKAIDGLQSRTITITLDTGDAYARLSALAKLSGNSATAAQGIKNQGKAYAAGGSVSPSLGVRGVDSVPALLMPDEHVWTTREVSAAGGHGQVQALRKAALSGSLPRFAAGGPVGGPVWSVHLDSDPIAASVKKAQAAAAGAINFNASAGVAQWAPMISRVLAMLGLSPALLGRVEKQMTTESGGNPNAINLWDSNAKAGHPSKGLMQTIDGTFQAYRNPAFSGNIYDPLANIYAALHYAESRYGKSLGYLGQGHGYDSGGWLKDGTVGHNTSGKPEAVLTGAQSTAFVQLAQAVHAMSSRPGQTSASFQDTSAWMHREAAAPTVLPPTALQSVFTSLVTYVAKSLGSALTGSTPAIRAAMGRVTSTVKSDFLATDRERNATATSMDAEVKVLARYRKELDDLNPKAKTYAAQHKKLSAEIDAESKVIAASQARLRDLSNLSGAQRSAIVKLISADNAQLTAEAAKRDALSRRIAATNAKLAADRSAAAAYSSNLRSSIIGAAGLSAQAAASPVASSSSAAGVSGTVWSGSGPMPVAAGSAASTAAAAPTIGSLLAGGQAILRNVRAFQSGLVKLARRGYDKTILDQVSQQGVDAGLPLITALLAASPTQVRQENAIQTAIAASAQRAGTVEAAAQFGGDIAKQQQLVASLSPKLVAVNREMGKIAAGVQANIAHALAAVDSKPEKDPSKTAKAKAKKSPARKPESAHIWTPVALGDAEKKAAAGAVIVEKHYHFEPKTANVTTAQFDAHNQLVDSRDRVGRKP